MDFRAIRDYFHLYIASAQEAMPSQFYMALIVALGIAAILSFAIGGAKRGLHISLIVATKEVIILIYEQLRIIGM